MALADIVAIAALVVALVAGLVAVAQVAQQYLGTAALIRKCDSIVYGPLPGRGKREFVLRQLRFKVVYSIPQISLSESLWPNRTNQTPLYSPPTKKLAPIIQKHDSQPSVGEASWVSFYKAVENSCVEELRYQLLEGDADHCPAELPVVPMQVSMRDIIVLALMSGMRITDASFSRELLLMQGPPGTISSAAHPMLGTILHFTPRNVSGNHGVTVTGKISPSWIRRLYGDCPVARTDVTPFERYHVEMMEGRWSKKILDYPGRPRYTFGKSGRSGEDDQDKQIVLYSRRHYGGYYDSRMDSRVNSPAATLGPINGHDSRNVTFGADFEIRENLPELLHPITHAEPQQSIIPWRKPWPRLEVDDIKDLSSLALPRQSPDRFRYSENLQEEDSFIPPGAPEAPPRDKHSAIVSLGTHDGLWSFSSKPSSSIILIATKNGHDYPQTHQKSWLRRIYCRILQHNVSDLDEQEGFLLPVESSPHCGWEVSDAFHLDPRSVPLPAESSRVSLSPECETPQFANVAEPMFPPDFLLYGKKIGRKEGPHSVGMDRWYAAVLQQKQRREARAKETEDLNFIKYNKSTNSKFTRRKYGKSAKYSGPGPSRSNNPSRIPVSFDRNSSDQNGSKHLSEDVKFDPDPVPSNALVPYQSPPRETQDHQSREGSLTNKRMKERSPDRNAYVESADEDSDSWSDFFSSDFLSSYNTGDDRESLVGSFRDEEAADAHSRTAIQIMGPAHPKSDSKKHRKDHQRPGKEKRKETQAERKIREAQNYRSKAEGPAREKEAYMREAFIREQIRQAQISEEQKEAERRQRARDEKRGIRMEARRQEADRGVINGCRSPTDVSWFWVSQMDIIPGYFATSWSGQFSQFVAIGTIAVVLEALLGFTDKDSLQYSWSHKRDTWDWLQAEKSTFPPYARNGRGGVVVAGRYQAVTFEAFEQKLPPLQLLHCYDYQVDRFPRIDDISDLNRQLELMGIDSWLSIVGRTPEITDGPANLLRTTPALVQKLMHEFGWCLEELDFYANDGGLQVIQDITRDLMYALGDESLTEAEQLFVLVALLRTAKVALSICQVQVLRQHKDYYQSTCRFI